MRNRLLPRTRAPEAHRQPLPLLSVLNSRRDCLAEQSRCGRNNAEPNNTALGSMPVLPDVGVQMAIAGCLNAAERKMMIMNARRAFTDLFRTLLHQLMTAQIRVHDLDLPELRQHNE